MELRRDHALNISCLRYPVRHQTIANKNSPKPGPNGTAVMNAEPGYLPVYPGCVARFAEPFDTASQHSSGGISAPGSKNLSSNACLKL